jgi:hypothetical protein
MVEEFKDDEEEDDEEEEDEEDEEDEEPGVDGDVEEPVEVALDPFDSGVTVIV